MPEACAEYIPRLSISSKSSNPLLHIVDRLMQQSVSTSPRRTESFSTFDEAWEIVFSVKINHYSQFGKKDADIMSSRSSSPDFSPLAVDTDLTPLPTYKPASTTSIDFSKLLSPPLLLHEDLTSGCGGQLWPAGMVLATHILRYHRNLLKDDRILELGAGGGLVGLAVALGCNIEQLMLVSDQENMMPLMEQNIVLNKLSSRVKPVIFNWGEQLPEAVKEQKPTVILAADCVYFEPAFPLLLHTLEELLDLSKDAVVFFCFKKRRRADMQFMKAAKKKFLIEEIEDENRSIFSREGLFLYTFRGKASSGK